MGWEYACSCAVTLYSVALCGVVCGVRTEYVDVVKVLITMGWWCVVVRTKHIASSRDAGVAESGLCVVVVADLRRAAVAPWGAFDVSGVGWSGGGAVRVRWLWDGLEAVVVLNLRRVACM